MNFYPDNEDQRSKAGALFDFGNDLRKVISQVRKFGNFIVRSLQAIALAAAVQGTVDVAEQVQEIVEPPEGEDAPDAPEQATQQATDTPPEQTVTESTESLEDIFNDLSEDQKDQTKDIGKAFASGSISKQTALSRLETIDAEALQDALNSGVENLDINSVSTLLATEQQPRENVFAQMSSEEIVTNEPQEMPLVDDTSLEDEQPPTPEAEVETDPEPINLAPLLEYSSTLVGETFTFTFVGVDPEGGEVSLLVDGQEINSLSYTLTELSNNPVPITVVVTDDQGLSFTSELQPPELAITDENQAPIVLEQSFVINENDVISATYEAYDIEDGLISITQDLGSFDFEAVGSMTSESVTFTDSEGLESTGVFDVTVIDDDFDYLVSKFDTPISLAYSGFPPGGFGFFPSVPVNEGLDFTLALDVVGVVQYSIFNQDDILLFEQIIPNTVLGGFDWFQRFEAENTPPTSSVYLRTREFDIFNGFQFFVGTEETIFT